VLDTQTGNEVAQAECVADTKSIALKGSFPALILRSLGAEVVNVDVAMPLPKPSAGLANVNVEGSTPFTRSNCPCLRGNVTTIRIAYVESRMVSFYVGLGAGDDGDSNGSIWRARITNLVEPRIPTREWSVTSTFGMFYVQWAIQGSNL
jgi:hypothetical protein